MECGLLIATPSLGAAPRPWITGSIAAVHGLSSCGMRDLPWSGIKPPLPALSGGFFTTEPPAKPLGSSDIWKPPSAESQDDHFALIMLFLRVMWRMSRQQR